MSEKIMKKGKRIICRQCGSDDVLFDAYAKWNIEKQVMEIESVFDDATCEVCDGECFTDEIEIDLPERIAEAMKETRRILLENGFTKSPNTFFNSYRHEHMPEIEMWRNGLMRPKNETVIGRFEGVNPTEAGFEIIYNHGQLCDISVLRFPRFATESDFKGAFERLRNYIQASYEYEPGLAAWMFGD